MNPVYLRMILYSIAATIAAAGLGVFDPAAGTLTLHLDDIGMAIAGAGLLNGVVFGVWGKK